MLRGGAELTALPGDRILECGAAGGRDPNRDGSGRGAAHHSLEPVAAEARDGRLQGGDATKAAGSAAP